MNDVTTPFPARVRKALAGAVRTPFTRRAWAELAYCLFGFPLGLAGFIVLVFLVGLGAGFTLSLIGSVLGMLLLILAMRFARLLGTAHRGMAALFLGERVDAPPPPRRPGRGPLARLEAWLRDGAGWRAAGYVLAKLPVSIAGLYAAVWWLNGLFNLISPVRWAAISGQTHTRKYGMGIFTPFPGVTLHATNYSGAWFGLLVGVVAVMTAPWLARGVTYADRALIRNLLGPTALDERVRDLEETRALAVDDSVALLKRLERDLHDGAQVRLVALAMSLDMAREKLADPSEAARARELLDGAHRNATEAIAELRDLTRGIHPPVLDAGLPDALATLAARSLVPVTLTVDVPERPTPAIETIAYFCAAELLTNVIKHSGAKRASITVTQDSQGTISLVVWDDGRGGAAIGTGTGLVGLQQRVRTVDGRFDVESPEGGPTEVRVVLPPRA